MLAHKLIDNLSPKFHDEIKCIMDSVKFDVGDFNDLFIDEKSFIRFINDGLVHLPYVDCFFELTKLGDTAGILATEDNTGIHGIAYGFDEYGFPGRHNVSFYFDFETQKISAFNLNTGGFLNRWGDLDMSLGAAFVAVLYFCVVISCTNTKLIETNPSEKLNKKKIKSGKCPIFSYKTLVLSMNSVDKELHGNGSSHQSPRVHLRRGHIRRLNSGKMTWVQACVVGDKCRGVIMKDYQLAHGI